MNTPNSSMAAISAPTGSAIASAAERIRSSAIPVACPCVAGRASSDFADDTFDQIVHRLEHRVRLLERRSGGDHHLARVVLERALEDDVFAFQHRRLDAIGLLLGRIRYRLAIGRHLDEAFL